MAFLVRYLLSIGVSAEQFGDVMDVFAFYGFHPCDIKLVPVNMHELLQTLRHSYWLVGIAAILMTMYFNSVARTDMERNQSTNLIVLVTGWTFFIVYLHRSVETMTAAAKWIPGPAPF